MSIKTINVPAEYLYISDVPEIKTTYNNDLPYNCIIDKQVTGVGGSHIALCNDEPYIVAVHMLRMIDNKVGQDKYKHVMKVSGDTKRTDVFEYLQAGGKKFLVTYDSVPKLRDFLGEKSTEFRLLVDEFHKLIQYLGSFKPSVCIKLLEQQSEFKSVSYMTATPTNYDYLPQPMKELDIVEFKWENAKTPNLSHSYVSKNITEAALSTILDILDNSENEAYVFYNSKKNVVTMIKKLLQCKPTIKLEDINILFAETESNTKFFKRHLGKNFKYGEFPDGLNNKRLTICSSMGYEGSDFFPNNNSNIKPISLIISDPNAKSMRFDISVDLTQIVGRFRANKVTGLLENYPVIYLWNTQKADFVLDENEYKSKLITLREQSKELIDSSAKNELLKSMIFDNVENEKNVFFLKEGDKPILHPYGYEASMSVYHAVHSDSYVLNNVDDKNEIKKDSKIVSKLSDLSPELSSYTVPTLRAEYTKALGRNPSVIKLMKEYQDLLTVRRESNFSEEAKEAVEAFLIDNSEFASWLDAGVTLSEMNSCGRTRDKIEELVSNKTRLAKACITLAQFSGYKEGSFVLKKELKEMIQKYYDHLGLKFKAKATDIEEYAEIVNNTTRLVNNKKETGIRIVRFK